MLDPSGEFALALDRRFEAVMFDWDGTAVPDRRADAGRIRALVEDLCGLGMDVAVVSGTNMDNVDGQLRARPRGPGSLFLCLNRGSEVFRVGDEVRCVHRRVATPDEEERLDAAARLTVQALGARGVRAEVVAARLNRRKIDLIPDPAWDDPPKARIAELLGAVEERLDVGGLDGIAEVVRIAEEASKEVGLPDPKVTSDAKHVEIGLTDKSDSARWFVDHLWRVGVGPGLLLVAGDEFGPLGGVPGSDLLMLVPEAVRSTAVSVGVEPGGVPEGVLHVGGGPDAFAEILEDQLERRRAGQTPDVDEDPAWSVASEGVDPQRERVHEALLTIADGRLGTSGSPIGTHEAATPEVLMAGVYRGEGDEEHLLPGPTWLQLPVDVGSGTSVRRVLDLRTGLLHQAVSGAAGEVRSLAFSAIARPGTVALRATVPGRAIRPWSAVGPDVETGVTDGVTWARVGGAGGGMAVAVGDGHPAAGPAHVERLGAYVGDGRLAPPAADALDALDAARREGYETLLRSHRSAWADRWERADVVIEGDPELQRAVRFCLFHLMASVAGEGEAAVGARGLSGEGYRGHVFWDADVYVLPFLAATHPSSARAMLEYRVRRLPAARAAAAAEGRRGARFPWESARTGVDVTPDEIIDLAGRRRAVRTGEMEVHIVADVAWAAAWYLDWTGDEAFATGPGRELLIETARYWTSRIRLDEHGRGHIDGVIGPDEYHEDVDDNAYTNVMARWNLRRTADLVLADPRGGQEGEAEAWRSLADALVDGYDPGTGRYEQFAGFYGLEPVLIAEEAHRRPIAADVVLGPERVAEAQIVKQPDVLMLHHLVPGEVAEDSLVPNLDFYEPRTAHGSSLSPGVHAALCARAGRTDEALEALRLAARIDLDDLTGTTAAGLHMAAMGSVWKALAMGFAGLRPIDGALAVDPRVPEAWRRLEIPVELRGVRARLIAHADGFSVEAEGPLEVLVGEERIGVDADAPLRVRGTSGAWEVEDR